jgi:hypothetical protein
MLQHTNHLVVAVKLGEPNVKCRIEVVVFLRISLLKALSRRLWLAVPLAAR